MKKQETKWYPPPVAQMRKCSMCGARWPRFDPVGTVEELAKDEWKEAQASSFMLGCLLLLVVVEIAAVAAWAWWWL